MAGLFDTPGQPQLMGATGPNGAAPNMSFLQPGGPTPTTIQPRDMFMGLAAVMPLLAQQPDRMGTAPGTPGLGDAKLATPVMGPARLPESRGMPVPGLASFLRPR